MLEFLNDWRLPRKLLAAFGILVVLFGAVGINGLVSTRKLDAIAQNHVDHGIAGMSALADVISNVKEMRIIVYTYYAAVNTPQEEADIRERLDKTKAALAKAVDEYKQVADESFTQDATTLSANVEALNKANDHLFAVRAAGDLPAAMTVLKTESRTASHEIIDLTEKLLDESRERSREQAAQGAETADFAIWLSGGLALVGIAGIVLIWLVLNASVAAPMSRIADVTTTLAEGGRADVPYRERHDEIGEIAGAVEQFRAAAEARAEIDAKAAREQEVVTSTLRGSLQAISEGDLTQTISAEFPPLTANSRATSTPPSVPCATSSAPSPKAPSPSAPARARSPRHPKTSPAAPRATPPASKRLRPRSPRWTSACAPPPPPPDAPCSAPTGR
ncbi:MCP four helix bundle domain-containing protein [Novosphingobium lindaniclasticum]